MQERIDICRAGPASRHLRIVAVSFGGCAVFVASTLSALPNSGAVSDANALAEAVGLGMANWWKPMVLCFPTHVSKRVRSRTPSRRPALSWRLMRSAC